LTSAVKISKKGVRFLPDTLNLTLFLPLNKHLSDQVMGNIDDGTEDIKRLAFDALELRVYDSPDNLETKELFHFS
jgi:hypothetical protein